MRDGERRLRAAITACGVTPQAQNTGSSSVLDSTARRSRASRDRRCRCLGLADMHRRAMHRGKARGDLDGADRIGGLKRPHRHDERPGKGPAARWDRVRYIGTFRRAHVAHLRGRRRAAPPRTRTSSRSTKATRSSRHHARDIGRLLDSSPSRQTRSAADRCGCRDRRRARVGADRPARYTPITGQGFGLRWQKRRKSSARSAGRMTRLPCTIAGRQRPRSGIAVDLRGRRAAPQPRSRSRVPPTPAALTLYPRPH